MQNYRKGIILAGGKATRLYPLTLSISKQLIPVYNKPMIYYPLTTLMLSGIRDILLISTEKDIKNFKDLLGDGNLWGINIQYAIQKKPEGIAQSLLIAENFLSGAPCALILGDNLFYGNSLTRIFQKANNNLSGATLFAYPVNNPERFGVVKFDNKFNVLDIAEKPQITKSNYAITGLYFYDENAVDYAKSLTPSKRGELEITDLNIIYLKNNNLKVEVFGRGIAWLDTGTFDSLHEASSLVRTLEHSQNLKIGYPDEISWRMGWIDDKELETLALKHEANDYGRYLLGLIKS